MSDKKNTLTRIDEFHSDEWPYCELYEPQPANDPHLTDQEQQEVLNAILLPSVQATETVLWEEVHIEEAPSYGIRHRVLSSLFGFFIGALCTSALLLIALTPGPSKPIHTEALDLLKELNAEFALRSAEEEMLQRASNPYKHLSGPEFIHRLRGQSAASNKLLWLEAAARKDERITSVLLDFLGSADEKTQIRALLALSAPFHSEQSIVRKRVVYGIQTTFSPFVRAYATKMLTHAYGVRVEKFLRARILIEQDSFVLALTTKMVQGLDNETDLLKQ